MEKKIKLKITTISSNNPVNVLKGEGVYYEKDGKILIKHIDKEGNMTSMIITDEKILLSRKSQYYQRKIPIRENEKTLGIMGEESTFTVLGKTACFHKDEKRGSVKLEYTLPDLSDEVTHFNIDAEFEFLKGNL